MKPHYTNTNNPVDFPKSENKMNERICELLAKGYSPGAIAMYVGGPVGTLEYHRVLKQLNPNCDKGCSHCGELRFGTGDCNCMED
jgi:hypothetical protein